MGNRHLSRDPHHTKDDGVWWYEEPVGITLFVEQRTKVATIIIPWRSIRAALKRKDKKEIEG